MIPRWSSALLLLCLPAPLFAADPVAIYPTKLDLRHPRQPHAIQVLGATTDGYSIDLRDQTQFTVADARVAAVDERGWVRPVGNGTTRVTVTVAGQTFSVPVTVQLPAAEPAISFRHEVMPVLSRAGCNAGACHGYSLGKNGFKLSLRGSDPDPDYTAILKQSFGRRVNPLAPETSLLVAKARGDVPHEGGARFQRGSLSDQILLQLDQPGRSRRPGRYQPTSSPCAWSPTSWCCARPETPPPADRRLRQRLDAGRHPPGHLQCQQRPLRQGRWRGPGHRRRTG